MIGGKGVGSSGKDRNKKKQKGLKKKKTVCGERIDRDTVQINLKILKEGAQKLGEVKAAEESSETKEVEPKKEAPVKEKTEAKPKEGAPDKK